VLTGGGGLDRHAAAWGWANAVHRLWTLVHGGLRDGVGGTLVAVTRGAAAEGSRWGATGHSEARRRPPTRCARDGKSSVHVSHSGEQPKQLGHTAVWLSGGDGTLAARCVA
jgi:hypothetical protein